MYVMSLLIQRIVDITSIGLGIGQKYRTEPGHRANWQLRRR